MSRKIVFLDIDGVLNSDETGAFYRKKYGKNGFGGFFREPIEPTYENVLWGQELVDNLKEIVDKTGAEIVISSTWRISHNCEMFTKMFKIYNFNDAKVVGRTPRFGAKRGLEIKDYLTKHPEITEYVILDDSTDMLEEQLANFVNTDERIGLSASDAEKAIRILNGE